MGKETVIQVQEAQRVPRRINPRKNMLRHIIIKLSKTKDKGKNIKSNKGKSTNNIQGDKGTPIKLSSDFSAETLQARRE